MSKPTYDFVDATFGFFQLIGRRPGAVLWIAFWQLALYAGLFALIFVLAAPAISFAFRIEAEGIDPDPAEVWQAFSGIIGGYLLVMLGFVIASLMAQGAWLRLLVRNEVAALIPLRFGGDEFRLLVVNLVFIAFWLIAFTVFFVVTGVVTGGSVLATGASDVGVGLALLINVLLGLGAAVLAVIVMLRFGAAPALTVGRKGIKLFESFGATKGVASWMFVSYLTLVAVYFVAATAVSVFQQVILLLTAAELFPTLAALENTEDPEVVLRVLGDALLEPGVLVALGVVVVLQLAVQILYEGSWHGVGAYVARRDAGDIPDDAIVTPTESVGDAPREG
jgi:hypothetical protein